MEGEKYRNQAQDDEHNRHAFVPLMRRAGEVVVGSVPISAQFAPPLRAEQVPSACNAGQPEKINSVHVKPLSFRTPNIVGMKRGFKSIAGGYHAL